jgi:adenine-specific DNA-methyltransferase
MAVENKMNEKKLRLLNLLREMFQLDQPDLDFGLYRIMHAKREQVEAFLATEFDQLIDKVFASRGARHEDEARKEYEAARQQAVEFGAPDPDAAPKVQQARARYEVVRLTGGEDVEIYDHLHRFFSRYYDEGDFMSLRRYGKGAAGGAESYAVPYDGSEVVLHWANKDQYYIKTTENFSHFSFDPRQALQKDERGISRQLFEEVGAGGTALKVHFRVVDAAEGAHNNVKAGDKDERYFILDDETPIAWEGTELVIRVNYRPDPDKAGQKSKWQEKRNAETVSKVLDRLARLSSESANPETAAEYHAVLARDVPKGKDKKQALLARYLGQYTASNTMDYFIHKDLGGFLRRELDFYLKNEVLKLDDFVGGEDADIQAGPSESRLKAMQSGLEKAQAIRLLSQRLIDFLTQLEDFQKKLWLKKKFVVETGYLITLDHIPATHYPIISANERQRLEWVRLFAIDEIKGDMVAVGYSVPLTVDFLRANPELIVDTACFDPFVAAEIISSIENLDVQGTGTLLNSDNFQALRILEEKHGGEVKGIYIDPPYNTDASPIVYKNNYRHSSWACLFSDRMEAAKRLVRSNGMFCVAIDDFEYPYLSALMGGHLGYQHLGTAVVRSKPQGRPTTSGFSSNHEYAAFWSWGDAPPIGRLPRIGSKAERYPHSDEQGIYTWANFRKSGTDSDRTDRKKSFYPVYVKNKHARLPAMNWNNEAEIWEINEEAAVDEIAIWPKDQDGNEKVWTCSAKRLIEEMADLKVIQAADGSIELQKKYRPNQDGALPGTWWDKPEYSASESGTKVLKDLFKTKDFDFPKSINLVIDNLRVLDIKRNDIVLDYFGGSGTTAGAVMALNREDGGKRRYILAEQGDYFDSVLKPRVQKEAYSSEWRNGVPILRDGISHCVRYARLESYEDCLNNLALNPTGDAVAKTGDAALKRDYLLRYMLDVETQGSQSLLNVAEFRDPTAYQLEIKKPGSDERVKRNIDLVETFNWLIGLHVDKLHAGRRFSATFGRKPDPLLPEDAHTRLQVETLAELPPSPAPQAGEGNTTWWFRPVEGYVRTVPGDDRHRRSVLVLWRTLSDDPEQDAACLEAFLARQMKFDPKRREDKTLYDLIYINGTHNLPNLGKYGEVRLLEEEFHRRMWAGEEN